ncbi:(deoxy)nucleoside triphosphate pyrophosphohydrolase [Microbacterium sp. C7(2022)]|uniref:(deoxy)nucleoside triphosphate pyrophosphohydrolase n=1 Tax=Microbacterium sp. C7(2022) TaxID=2992759 RepID=UPI00237BA616|nr:(deoxy)nucleoside triphosphate pyrophosphohydrolase [Microbacterium sp. C7(2022)]MDE0546860.1 (deoxy)nucleoside triphosphate pyrophosphohydrolase [Microbacterium sp. C7(2022)]
MSTTRPQPLIVVAAVVTDNARVLACRRAPGRTSAGLWEFPGGKVEDGEAEADALIREIREELGVEIHVGAHLTTDDTRLGSRTIRLVCFRATLKGALPVSSTDHDAMRWLRRDELREVRWAAPDLPAVLLLEHEAPKT